MSAPGSIPNTPQELLEAQAAVPPAYAYRVLGIALGVLADRCLLWVSLLGSFALYGYAVYEPSTLRLITATACTLLTFTPQVIARPKTGGGKP